MERERLRMEKMLAKEKSRLQQQLQSPHQQLQPLDSPRLLFHDDPSALVPDRFHSASTSTSSSDNDVFSQFVRENQERFAQLVQQHRVAASTLSERIRLQQQQQLCNAFASSGNNSSPHRIQHQQQQQQQRVSTATAAAAASAASATTSSTTSPASLSNKESSGSQQPKVHHIQIQRESLNCELSGDGQVEVRTESNAKLQIIVNEDAKTVLAKTTSAATAASSSPVAKSVNEGSSSKREDLLCGGGSESHSDVGSSCSDEVAEGSVVDRDDDDGESDSSTLSSCNSSQLSATAASSASPKCKTRGSSGTAANAKNLQVKDSENKIGDKAEAGDKRETVTEENKERKKEDGEKQVELKSGVGATTKKCPPSVVTLGGESSAVHRSSSSSSRLSSSSSGFSSIGPNSSHVDRASAALQKLQQLQERRAAFHHPTFANHFGFGRSGTGLRANSKTSMELIDDFATNGIMAKQQQLFPSVGSFPNLMSQTAVMTDTAGSESTLSSDTHSTATTASSSSSSSTSASARRTSKSSSTTTINCNGKLSVAKCKSGAMDYATNGKDSRASASGTYR